MTTLRINGGDRICPKCQEPWDILDCCTEITCPLGQENVEAIKADLAYHDRENERAAERAYRDYAVRRDAEDPSFARCMGW